MIKLQEMTPKVYYEHSRDFQFIGRLYDVVLNSTKTNSDTLYNLPFSDNFNTKLIDLMTMTLGFKSKHNYNLSQLKALCSAFVEILRNKGNKHAIELACNVITNAEGVTDNIIAEIDAEKCNVDFYVPETLSDINLLKDLMTYILPAGMTFNIIRSVLKNLQSTTKITIVENVKYENIRDQNTSTIVNKVEYLNNTKNAAIAYTNPGFLVNSSVIYPENIGSLSTPKISLEKSANDYFSEDDYLIVDTDNNTNSLKLYVENNYYKTLSSLEKYIFVE